ncbi:MAG: carbohydrate kinase [Lachnospiraceae bacterium]|nr:carbohydrate kinase [Lachnospiraceae bacterium]
MFLAGLDIGTTGCKISVFQTDGRFLDNVYREYPVQRSHNVHEVDAGSIWSAVQTVIKEAEEKYHGIAGIGVTSFGETFVMLDEKDEPILPSMLYTDLRGEEQCAALSEKIGKEKLIEITGLKPHYMYSLPKLMWMKEKKTEAYSRARHVLLMEDYIVYMLTGEAQIDYSLAARTMAFDIRKLCWSNDILKWAGIDADLLSRPVPTGTCAGCVRPDVAKRLGLNHDVRIISVSHDQVAAAIGSGVLDEHSTVDGAGTVQCMTPVFQDYDASKMAENNYGIVPYIKPGNYVTYAFSYTGGALVKWFVDNLAGFAAKEADEKGTSIYDQLQGESSGEPTGILVLPHFAGAATPYMDGGSKGAVIGLTLSHTQQDIYRAIMEGICYEMRLNQDCLAQAGITIAPLRATGGGAKSRVWMQMKADVLNVPVTALETGEAGAAGSAMLVGVAVGAFKNLEEASAVMVKERETFFPRVEFHKKYEVIYQRYKKLYEAVRPLV